ncbi:DUF4181 domain-containing protein [Jeotgalibacillus proteolyticus]|uniref:DUF4181 domain-containing protein n=1 Tax=Jeotgalibacillus proteolyticus TaxID=2082395 RepID=A0A2S5GF38_9BACL|nr:DUF4181 domain-containing protein [Jeotgalibacillus proteolyticus]PPA71657.1 hypothetical protein C4B60_06270 [Jeotgalibacillus proteolyticus]
MIWVNLLLVVAGVFLMVSAVKYSLLRLFELEREKTVLFSSNYVNERHKKIDQLVRIFSVIVLILSFGAAILFFEEYILLVFAVSLLFILAELGLKAFFEWKYSENPKRSIVTLAEMSILFAASILVIIYFMQISF